MAKSSAPKSGGTSRIRFIMLDAEIPEGDLSQITEAIQNALKPATTTIVQQRVAPKPAPAIVNLSANVQEMDAEDVDFDPEEGDGVAPEAKSARAKGPTKPRKPTTPKVIDLDLTTGTSLEAFATDKSPKNEPERNLVVLAWFHEHRNSEPVTVNHVYTCYKALKWGIGIPDFSWPLRALKKEQLINSPGRGQYVINHLGLARVNKMGTTA